jgi:molybdenum cofactor synthesis domain-containing protein
MGKIVALCKSERRGTKKIAVKTAFFITEHGIADDAHGGRWHRQVSLLAAEEIAAFQEKGAQVAFGDFGENVVVSGFDLKKLPLRTRFKAGEVVLEMTQIGKKCHSHCEIYKTMGDCIMPREGVFARVLHGGWLKAGDKIEIFTEKIPLDAAIITASDKGAQGEREDKSGARAKEMLEKAGYKVVCREILPDEQAILQNKMIELSDLGVALIVTSGGTGFSVRDVTPEATMAVVERPAPGIAEAMRMFSMQITKRAMLSRATAGIRKRTLIVNLPGSEKAVAECLGFILPELQHGLEILRGETGECAQK